MFKAFEVVKNLPNGYRVFNYGNDQSPALFNYYHELLCGDFVPILYAHQLWTKNWTQISKIYNKSNDPEVGAVFVGRFGKFHAEFGHCGIVTEVFSDGEFSTIEQNGGEKYVFRYRRTKEKVLGFLVPKKVKCK